MEQRKPVIIQDTERLIDEILNNRTGEPEIWANPPGVKPFGDKAEKAQERHSSQPQNEQQSSNLKKMKNESEPVDTPTIATVQPTTPLWHYLRFIDKQGENPNLAESHTERTQWRSRLITVFQRPQSKSTSGFGD